MLSLGRCFVLLGCLVGLATTAEASQPISVLGKVVLPRAAANKPRAVKVCLNYGQHCAFTRYDGSFELPDISVGTYLLEVNSVGYRFAQYKVQVGAKGDRQVQAIKYEFPGSTRQHITYPLTLEPLGPTNYFQVRQGYNFWSILRSPTIMMMAPLMIMLLLFRWFVDPEELKKTMEEQAQKDKEGKTKEKKLQ